MSSDLVTADFNVDGKLDLAASIGFGGVGGVAVFLGNGDGTFPLHALTPPGNGEAGPFSVVDVNGDAKPDLVFGQFVLIGKGDGTFISRLVFDGIASLTADVNRDGKIDVVVVLPSSRLGICLGRGDGTFSSPITLNAPFDADSFVAGDFNGDNLIDLAIEAAAPRGQTVSIAVLPGKGDGSFLQPVITSGVPGPIFAAADFNRDGHLDVISGNSVLVGSGRGSFSPPVFFGVTGTVCNANPIVLCAPNHSAVIAADLNVDGRPDIAAAYRFQGGIAGIGYGGSVLLNDSPGDGFVAPGVSSATWVAPVGVNSLVTAFGRNLAPLTETASTTPWPTTLGGVRIHVTYRFAITGDLIADLLAPLSYVSPTQINYQLPGDVPYADEGSFVYVAIERVGSPFEHKGLAVPVNSLALGFFTLNSSGLAAASALRILADGTRVPVEVAICSVRTCDPVPINVTQGAVYLSVFGTGFSKASLAETTCDAGGQRAQATYVGPQNQYAGLDQINMLLPSSLAGSSDVLVQCASGPDIRSNSVRIRVE